MPEQFGLLSSWVGCVFFSIRYALRRQIDSASDDAVRLDAICYRSLLDPILYRFVGFDSVCDERVGLHTVHNRTRRNARVRADTVDRHFGIPLSLRKATRSRVIGKPIIGQYAQKFEF